MAKLMNLISNSLKERVEMVVRRPKRRRIGQGIIASSIPEIEAKCKELRYREHEEKKDLKIIPVLFICGDRKILSETEAQWYKSMGADVRRLSETEVKSLNIK